MSSVETRVEDCELPETWGSGRLDEVCHQMKQGKILPQKEIHEIGSYPVFGANGCIGYCEDYFLEEPRVLITCRGSTCGVINRSPARSFVTNNAMILFEKDCLDNDFLFFVLQEFSTKGFKTGSGQPQLTQGILNSHAIPLPPLPEQKKIAHILSTVQRAIEAQERIIQTTTELKKALMHKLFTEGLRNEPQKQTEIGPIPESWEVAPLSSCAVVQTGIAKGRKIDPKDAVELPYLRVANVQDGYLDLTEMKTITIRKDEEARYALHEGDVVLTEGGDFDKLGRGFIWHGQVDRCVHQNHVFAVRPDTKRISSEFFAYQSQSPYGKAYFLSVAHKTTNLACINTTKLKAFPVLLPSQEQQKDIVDACQSIDGKIASARAKHSALQDLFRTLLHELMTAKTRVHKLELSA